ncbi:MAG: ribonuclease E/G [Rubritepida sp.]|nr:ribonuclease E/G [Rubritepida sp.]
MTKRMLIDAAHPEETRVVVMDGSRVEEFDLEAANRLALKGNIYLARVVRVEPSLQAAFVEYGGNRHGFLAFGEIHPDYYQIPVADRQRLIEAQEAEAREEAEAEAREEERRAQALARREAAKAAAAAILAATPGAEEDATPEALAAQLAAEAAAQAILSAAPAEAAASDGGTDEGAGEEPVADDMAGDVPARGAAGPAGAEPNGEDGEEPTGRVEILPPSDAPPPETIGVSDGDAEGDADAEAEERARERRSSPRFLRNYKIQEVIRRRQILLVQVVKEERGTKGAALTTYISLAGRFSVLMPNSPRGGGVSRKITSAADRRRLREIIEELEMPRGMSLIVRTAGAQRPKPEIKRDCEYLLRLWDDIRERTLASSAPALIYEEADLIKRAIRDGYARDMDEIFVEGDEACAQAREFMRMLMPEHVGKIKAYRDGAVPLFSRYQAEAQLDAMHDPTVQLKSGGYVVINQTEALVAIDVNSGRATRERNIEDTALKTNLEAADEVARQLRLRDLAGLIVIDFIDMDSNRHNAMVEKRLKDALRHDRARIQVGRISHFGLLEMSRQRLRPSLTEQAFITCPHCNGRGVVRNVESSAIAALRAVEEECARRRAAEITVHVTTPVALYLLNRKRDRLAEIEGRWGVTVLFEPDDSLRGAETRIERGRAAALPPGDERPAALRMDYAPEPEEDAEDDALAEEAEAAGPRDAAGAAGEEERARRRRRRRRGRRENGAERAPGAPPAPGEDEDTDAPGEEAEAAAPVPAPEGAEAPEAPEGEDEPARRRRGRRGGRRRREGEEGAVAAPLAEAVPLGEPAPPAYAGPTPADPFAGTSDSLLAAMEAAEAAAEAALAAARAPAPRPAPEKPAAAPAEAPIAETRVSETPVAEAPIAEAPVTEAPVAGARIAAGPIEAGPTPAGPAAEAAPVAPPPAPAQPAAPLIGPAIQPKPVEEAAAAAPRRGGWWKR